MPNVSAPLGTLKLRGQPADALPGPLEEKYFNWERKPSGDRPTHVTGMDLRSCVSGHGVTSKSLTE